MPGSQRVGVECVGQAEHGYAVRNDRELLRRPRADPLRRRVRRLELRMICLDRPQFLHEAVIFRVGNLGRVENEILVVVAGYLWGRIFCWRATNTLTLHP